MNKPGVLVVDDDPFIVKLLKANLEARDFEVTEAMDGESAIALCEEAPPDIVLLDITLPGINGFQVCGRIRQWSCLPIIMISARVEQDCKKLALSCGANDYIAKPFVIDDILTRVNALLASKEANVA